MARLAASPRMSPHDLSSLLASMRTAVPGRSAARWQGAETTHRCALGSSALELARNSIWIGRSDRLDGQLAVWLASPPSSCPRGSVRHRRTVWTSLVPEAASAGRPHSPSPCCKPLPMELVHAPCARPASCCCNQRDPVAPAAQQGCHGCITTHPLRPTVRHGMDGSNINTSSGAVSVSSS